MSDAERSVAGPGGSGPATNRMVITLLSLVGFFVALYLWAHNAGLTGPIVCGIGDCATVQSSEYATIGPVPVSAIGVVGYLALILLAFLGLQPAHRESKIIGGLLLAGSAGAVVFSAYLTYLEAAVIQAWCQYCVVSAILITLIFLASLPEAVRLKGPRGNS
ncbi:MAG: vitamin K epoxide reductase family protein [Gemmatimonadetes bacterium]|nr:vitamin K epoxide reductase family protein [Gemmatimonadota bacterium]MDA1103256.1 vitamin K epoxide reductase family protein [Gemmatimonadota bacterium]